MQLTYAHIKNFKSIKDIEIDFTPFLNKTVLISGENRDEVGLDSNKSGKTCFVESFIWVLFGSQLIRGNSEEIVRHGEKEATGILRFDNGIEIERKLKGKPNISIIIGLMVKIKLSLMPTVKSYSFLILGWQRRTLLLLKMEFI